MTAFLLEDSALLLLIGLYMSNFKKLMTGSKSESPVFISKKLELESNFNKTGLVQGQSLSLSLTQAQPNGPVPPLQN